MGRPSDRRRSARRSGKRERARVKRHTRGEFWLIVPGGGTVHVKAGRKKYERAWRAAVLSHLSVSHNSEREGTQDDGQATPPGALSSLPGR